MLVYQMIFIDFLDKAEAGRTLP